MTEDTLHSALKAAAWKRSEAIIQLLLESIKTKKQEVGAGFRLLLNETAQNLIINTGSLGRSLRLTLAIPLAILRRLDSSSPKPQITVVMSSAIEAQHLPGAFDLESHGNDVLKISLLVRGPKYRDQLPYGDVVVGTPGYLRREILSRRLDPKGAKLLIIDDVDEMLYKQLDQNCPAIIK